MKTPLQRVKNPTGRLDWLAGALLERAVERRNDPVLSAAYAEIRAPLEEVIKNQLGPGNHKLKGLKRYVEILAGLIQAKAQQRRVA